jgi:hypothetical protein
MKNHKILILATVLSLSGLTVSTGLAQTATLLPALNSTDKILTIDPALLTSPVTTVAPSTTTSPAATTDTTTSTPPVDPAATATGTAPTANNSDGIIVTGTTVPADTATPPAGTIPPRTTQPPVGTSTGATGLTNPDLRPPATQNPPAEACPPINPLSTGTTECPRTEKIPVIPQIPYPLLATPLLGVLLFWLILSTLNRRQGRMEHRLRQKHLSVEHQKTVSASRNTLYLDLLNQVSSQLGSPDGLDQKSLQNFSSRIELLGSPEVQSLSQKLTTSLADNDRAQTKILLKNLALQIRKEL